MAAVKKAVSATDAGVMIVQELQSSPSVKMKSLAPKTPERNGSPVAKIGEFSRNGDSRASLPVTSSTSSLPSLNKQKFIATDLPLVSRSMEKLSLQNNELFNLASLTSHLASVPQILLKNKKILEEDSKVLCLDWCSDSKFLATSLQNGQLCIWDTHAKERVQTIPTPCTWVFAVAYSPSQNFIAAGGLDSKCGVYKLPRGKQTMYESQQVAQHLSYVLACSFTTSDHQILTASSDKTCGLWDVESAHLIRDFVGHSSDVRSLDFKKAAGYCFVTGSSDKQVGLWDMRTSKCVQSFFSHTDEVNQVRFFPNGDAVGSVSDDMTCKLFDLRMNLEISTYKRSSIFFPACSIDFSLNGRLIFIGYCDHSFHVWDTLKNAHCGSMYSHENKVNALQLSPDGSCLATGSWDQTIKLWS